MARLIGIPRSVAGSLRRVLSGSAGDVVWKLSVLTLLLLLGVGLLAYGGVTAAFVGGTILASLLSDDIRQLVKDVYNRRWAEATLPSVSLPFRS